MRQALCSGALTRATLYHQAAYQSANDAPPRWHAMASAIAGAAVAASFAAEHAWADAGQSTVAPPQASAAVEAVNAYARPTRLIGLPAAVTLYQYEVCPYCCKVKAVLDLHKIPYKVVEVNPLTKAELSWSTYKKVPVVKLGEEVLVDSSAIISRLAAEVEGVGGAVEKKKAWFGSATAPANPDFSPEVVRWRKWVDDVFVKVLTANIYRSWDESFQTFKYITDQTNWSWGTRELARMSGAVLMWRVGKNMPAKYKIEGDLRQALYGACNEFLDSLGDQPFHGGAQPDLADLAVFGVLRSVWGTDTFNDVMCSTRMGQWYGRMCERVGPSARLKE